MRKYFLSLLTVLSVIVLIGAVATPAMADTSSTNTGGEGQYRWAELNVTTTNTDENETMEHTLNMTVPETIATNHTLDGTLSVEHFNGVNTTTTNWVNVTIANETGGEIRTFTRKITLGENETRDFTLDTDFPENDNCSVKIEYEHSESTETPQVILMNTDVVDNTQFSMITTTAMITQLIPLVVIVAFLIPMIKSLMTDVGESATDATGGSY